MKSQFEPVLKNIVAHNAYICNMYITYAKMSFWNLGHSPKNNVARMWLWSLWTVHIKYGKNNFRFHHCDESSKYLNNNALIKCGIYVCFYDVAYFALLCCAQCNRILLYICCAYIHKRNLEKLFEISLNSEIKLFLFLLKQRVCMNVSPKKIKSKFNSGAACYEIVINYTHTKNK